jgi:apolipoprotein N-acyltransferase
MPNFDPPTPGGVLHRLHGAVLPFRAIENRVGFIRADWSGLSQLIDPYGRIVQQADLGRAEVLVADVPTGDGRGTCFTKLGDWVAWLSVAVVAAFGVSRVAGRVQRDGGPRRFVGRNAAERDVSGRVAGTS